MQTWLHRCRSVLLVIVIDCDDDNANGAAMNAAGTRTTITGEQMDDVDEQLKGIERTLVVKTAVGEHVYVAGGEDL